MLSLRLIINGPHGAVQMKYIESPSMAKTQEYVDNKRN